MKIALIAGLCAVFTMQVAAPAAFAEAPHTKVYRPQMLPQLYVSEEKAKAVCKEDPVVWVNWSARRSHLPDDKYYGHTVTGAYACAAAAAAAGVKPAV